MAFHLALGFILFQFNFLSKFYLFAICFYFLYRIVSTSNRNDEVLVAAGYVMGFEVLSRMTGGAITYEFAKYAVIGFILIGMLYKGFKKSSWPYILYMVLLVPGIIYSAINLNYDTNVANAIGFNLSGPFCLGIAALYCYKKRIELKKLEIILMAILLPLISITVYVFLYSPNVRDVLSGTASNFGASGGFGPNQVSTVLGLGAFILLSRILLIKNSAINIIDIALLGAMGYRALITFSRGGVITAVACGIIFIFIFLLKMNISKRIKFFPKLVFIISLFFGIWFVSTYATLGLIANRYANEDASGREKETLASGRAAIFQTELAAFKENPLTGIGVGKSKEYRKEKISVEAASHNEISRLLSEHGLFGLIALLILLFTPLFIYLTNKSNIFLLPFLCFWFLTINHSSMRIAAPAFIYALCLLNLDYAPKKKPALHRK